ncbi:arylamine N-acetyltransferase family protein [Kribbella sp. CA-247076]|uniref:arylamine N-acetyltransferase family protein n=1 Tax=Kribbella sp. CA-247076 TaxID=3239941 RepID=UPI003D94D806
MQRSELLDRLGHHGPVAADASTLVAVHRAWRHAVPYENLDIQLGRPITLDPQAIVDKLVRRGRGGYCFEQNAGLAALLRQLGFDVTMVEAGVLRETRGDAMWGNHNVLLVDVGGRLWIADAGIGDGFIDPLPLQEGPHAQGDFVYRLERLDPHTWRFHHHPGGTIASYDFRLESRELGDFAARSHELSTAPDSPYVTTLIVATPMAGGTLLLLSRTLRELTADSKNIRVLDSMDEFATILAGRFHIPLDDLGPTGIDRLWEQACAQHDLREARSQRAG